MPGTYSCTLWRDRPDFGWLPGPKRVETFETGLDPEDASSMNAVIAAAAARRDRGEYADLCLYRLEVRVSGYRGDCGLPVLGVA
jgi:hypothetical protein